MRGRHVLAQLAVALAVLAAGNFVVQFLARNAVPRALLRTAAAAEPATDLFLGNSTMAAGADTEAFAGVVGGRPFNLALGATDPVEHLVLYRAAARHHRAAVYYGFLDTQLTDMPRGDWDALVGNRALAYYVEPEVSFRHYFPHAPLRATGLSLAAHFPLVVERTTVWAKVEAVRRRLGGLGMPKRETNRFGRAEDFARLEADPTEFAERLDGAARAPLSPPVAELFAAVRANGCPLYVVAMPMPASYRLRYYCGSGWESYRAHLAALIRQAGGTFVPSADWVADSGFADALHLNGDGAREFSVRLAAFERAK